MKFRAWHKKRRKYYPVIHLHMEEKHPFVTCAGFDVIEQKEIHIQIQPGDFILEKGVVIKGVEIWEGDRVLLLSSESRVIKFKNGGFGYDGLGGEFIALADHRYLDEILGKYKVVGNIHENKGEK